jgi:hypothetical protein
MSEHPISLGEHYQSCILKSAFLYLRRSFKPAFLHPEKEM